MSGICRARNALCPAQLLSRLFRIPRSFSTACNPLRQDDHNPNVDPSSLQATLDAQRRANRDSLVHRVPVADIPQAIFHRPALEYAKPRKPRENKKQKQKPKGQNDTRKSQKTRHKQHFREIPPPDYVGRYIDPLDDIPVADANLPWFALSYIDNDNPMTRLNAEISAFSAYMQTTPQEDAARMIVANKTKSIFDLRFQGLELDLFGSQRSGLASASSDVDLRIYSPQYENPHQNLPPRYRTRQALLKVLQKATTHFRNHPEYSSCNLLHSRYPLLSMIHVKSGIDIQIVASNDTIVAREAMKRYMEEYPALRPIYSVVRHMLAIRGLTDVFLGGLGSYSIFMMVVASFKHHPRPEDNSLAQHLIDFLTFYTRLDTDTQWVSIEPPLITEKIEAKPTQTLEEKKQLKDQLGIGKVNPEQPYLFSLRDPADETNDLGRKCFAWKHVQTTMAVLREELLLRLEANEGGLVLTPLVGRNFKQYERKRNTLRNFERTHKEPAEWSKHIDTVSAKEAEPVINFSEELEQETDSGEKSEKLDSGEEFEEATVDFGEETKEPSMESSEEFKEPSMDSSKDSEDSIVGKTEGSGSI